MILNNLECVHKLNTKDNETIDFFFLLGITLSLFLFSCSNDDNNDDSQEDVYDLTWIDSNLNTAILRIDEANIDGEIAFADTTCVPTIFLSAEDIEIKVEWWDSYQVYAKKEYAVLDTLLIREMSYADSNNQLVKNDSINGKISLKSYRYVDQPTQDSIYIEGVFHLKITLQDGKRKDVKSNFHYGGLSPKNECIGGL